MNQTSVLDAIATRQSPAKLQAEQPPRDLIERLLELAVRAPNHYLNQPWRFFVVAGSERERLGDVFADRLKKHLPNPDSPEAKVSLDRERKKPLRAPVVIVVAAKHGENPKALPIEDVSATAAAVENILLAAPALGLGAFWRTGEPAFDEGVKAHFGLGPEDDIVAFVYVGYPDAFGTITPRDSAESKTEWRGW